MWAVIGQIRRSDTNRRIGYGWGWWTDFGCQCESERFDCRDDYGCWWEIYDQCADHKSGISLFLYRVCFPDYYGGQSFRHNVRLKEDNQMIDEVVVIGYVPFGRVTWRDLFRKSVRTSSKTRLFWVIRYKACKGRSQVWTSRSATNGRYLFPDYSWL